jgi:Helix-turn-helix
MNERMICEQEYDFALSLIGVTELTHAVEDALFEAGCSDATLSWVYGGLFMEFSRTAPSLEEAILSAIRDVRKANIGADVLMIDECNMVTQSEIARRSGHTRQYISQLINGTRGPGTFPPPHCHLNDTVQLWAWCEVSQWMYENNIIKRSVYEDFLTIDAINMALRANRGECVPSALVSRYAKELAVGQKMND